MLCITRHIGERIVIGTNIFVEVLGVELRTSAENAIVFHHDEDRQKYVRLLVYNSTEKTESEHILNRFGHLKIENNVVINIREIRGTIIALSVSAPPYLSVDREEIFVRKQRESLAV